LIFIHPLPEPPLVLTNDLRSISILPDLERIPKIPILPFSRSTKINIELLTTIDIDNSCLHRTPPKDFEFDLAFGFDLSPLRTI